MLRKALSRNRQSDAATANRKRSSARLTQPRFQNTTCPSPRIRQEQRRFSDADYTLTTAAPKQTPARSKLHIEFWVAPSHHSGKPSRASLNSPSDPMSSSLRFQVPGMPYEREMTVLIPEWASDSEVNMDLVDPHEQSPPQSRRRARSSGTGRKDDHDQRVSA